MIKRVRILFILCVSLFCVQLNAQQTTREQLLKLFYKAQQATKDNDTQTAYNTYIEIMKLSPRLPEPYLRVASILENDSVNEKSIQKAIIAYKAYLQLTPENPDSVYISSKIARLNTLLIPRTTTTPAPPVETAVVTKPTEPLKVVVVEKEPVKEVAPVVATNREPAIAFTGLAGKWVSSETAANGREAWILNISNENNGTRIVLDDNSAVKSTQLFKQQEAACTSVQTNGEELSFLLTVTNNTEKTSTNEKSQNNIAKAIGEFTQDMLNISSWDFGTEATKPDMNLKYCYEFRLKNRDGVLSGTVSTKVYELQASGESLLNEQQKNCEFFRAPDDYYGFVFYWPDANERANHQEYRDLVNLMQRRSIQEADALNNLGCLYLSGVGTPRNTKLAVAYFMEAVGSNNVFSMLNMAQLYQDGTGVVADMEKARAMYRKAMTRGYKDAEVLLGDTYMISGKETNKEEAMKCYQHALTQGSMLAAYRLGWLHEEGIGVEQNSKKAWEYYQKAVSGNYAKAMVKVGRCYRDGIHVEKNAEQALRWLNSAAVLNEPEAMNELSEMYLRGIGVEADFAKSRTWLLSYKRNANKLIQGYHSMNVR